ncbi:MAG: energy-coupling factor transporter transmembrane protein EcfT, partial [Microlunatus sp.]|nr:energy-coupling factor transporter transmembrane protein EcfT [Microlunatus sp.]
QLRALWWVLLAIGIAQVVIASWPVAVSVVVTVQLLVLAAGLVTLTTTTTAMSDVVVRLLGPFRRFGVAPERVGLLIALSIRAVPVVLGLADQIRDAQRARGLSASPRAFAVPLLVRALRHAQQTGDALIARGLDD